MTSSKLKVLVTVPNLGNIDRFVVAKLSEMEKDDRFDVRVAYPSASPSEHTRAHAMLAFLDDEYDYWVSMDADNPPALSPLDLIDHDFDLVGLPTPVWQHGDTSVSLHWNVYQDLPHGFKPILETDKKIEEVDAIGTGCYVVARRVMENLKEARPFVRETFPSGVVKVGSDLSFSRKVRAAGFKIHVHWDYLCNHFATVNLYEVIRLNRHCARDAVAEAAKTRQDGMAQLDALATTDERAFTPAARPGFRAFDAMAVELETAELLHALVRNVKPKVAVESGTGTGYATLAIAQALKDNGEHGAPGMLYTFEAEPDYRDLAMKRVRGYDVQFVDGIDEEAMAKWNPDFVFLDSGPDSRLRELAFWIKRGGVFLVVHDSHRYAGVLKTGEMQRRGFNLGGPRGLWFADMR